MNATIGRGSERGGDGDVERGCLGSSDSVFVVDFPVSLSSSSERFCLLREGLLMQR